MGWRSGPSILFTHDTQIGTPSKGPIRTFRNEKGVVTVLRPVAEVFESDTGLVAAQSRAPYLNSQGHRPPPLPPHKPTNSLTDKVHDYIGILPTKFDTPLLDDSSAPWHISRSPSRMKARVGKQNPAVFRRSAYPARASSMVSNRSARNPPSIDSLISPQDHVAGASSVARWKCLYNSLTQAPQRHFNKQQQPCEQHWCSQIRIRTVLHQRLKSSTKLGW